MVNEFLRHVGSGRLDAVEAMLADSPSLVNTIGPHPFWGGRPQALHVAIETNRRDLVDLLLAHGADVNGTNDQYDHWSPLMLAIQRDRAELRDLLLARGARIGLLEALMMADDVRVEALLQADGLPAIAPNGGSILAFARTPFAIDRLLALGAPTDLRDRWGSSPIDAMSRLGAHGRALVDHMTARGIAAEPKHYARLDDQARLSSLIQADPAIARRDEVMMAAVDFGHRGLVSWLLERGGNVNARSDWGSRQTALHSAAWNGDLDMVKLLAAAGADRAARDAEHDNTPEGWAQVAIGVTNNPRCAEVAAFLKQA
jgi:ankyrin repeat protein